MFILEVLILGLFILLAFLNYAYANNKSEFLNIVQPKGTVDDYQLALKIHEEIKKSNFTSLKINTTNGIKTYSLTTFKRARSKIDTSSIQFLLYTRMNMYDGQYLNLDVNKVHSSLFKPREDVKIIIHSWLYDTHKNFPKIITEEYLRKHDYNVIVIDYGKIADDLFYPGTVVQSKAIGQYIARFLTTLIYCGVSPKRMHIIAFGLGCHIAGFAGECITPKLGRITVLSPVGAGFLTDALSVLGGAGKLTYEHADFVDAIHTSCDSLGTTFRVGHADFYPNSGVTQPGCEGFLQATCSHMRSFLYFEESISRSIFSSVQCDNLICCPTVNILMGDPASPLLWGDYCLETTRAPPYGKPQPWYKSQERTQSHIKKIDKTSRSSACVVDVPRKLIILLASNILNLVFLYITY